MSRHTDLELFVHIARSGSLVSAGRALGISGAAVSKRLMSLEQRLGVRLVQRTTRQLRITPEGEQYLREGTRLLNGLDELEQSLRGVVAQPTGLLRVNASFGYGRKVIAQLLGEFGKRYPDLEVQLHLSDRPLNLVEEGYDIGIRIGELSDTRLSARRLRCNRRILCASPGYLAAHGTPRRLSEVSSHIAIVLHENDQTFGNWALRNGSRRETIKVRARMSTNDGETALAWACMGFGLLLRSEWDIHQMVDAGQLEVVLPDWYAPADIYAVFPTRDQLSAKTRMFIDFMVEQQYQPTSAAGRNVVKAEK